MIDNTVSLRCFCSWPQTKLQSIFLPDVIKLSKLTTTNVPPPFLRPPHRFRPASSPARATKYLYNVYWTLPQDTFPLNKQKNHAPPFLGRRPSKDGFCSSGRAWYPSFSCPVWGKSGHRTCAHPRVSGIPPLLSGEAKQKARGNFLSWRKATRRRKFSTNLFL